MTVRPSPTQRPDAADRLPISVPPALARSTSAKADRAGTDLSVSSLVSAAMHFDLQAVTEAAHTSIADHGVVRTWERLIHPVWSSLGGGRDDTDAPVAAERLFNRAMQEVLTAAGRSLHRAPTQVLLACADEEHQTLSLDALAAALAEYGVGTCVLGARVPPDATAAAVSRLRPAVVIIWSQARETADPRQITSLLAACPGPTVITAGPGWNPATLPAKAATAATTVPAVFNQTVALLNGTARSAA